MKVLWMKLQVTCEVLDASGYEGDLNLAGTGILRVDFEVFDDLLFVYTLCHFIYLLIRNLRICPLADRISSPSPEIPLETSI